MRHWFAFLIGSGLLAFATGCTSLTVKEYPVVAPSRPVTPGIAVGSLLDSRLAEGKDLENMQVHLDASEMRASVAKALESSPHFGRVINLPDEALSGGEAAVVTAARRAGADYVVNFQVDKFAVTHLGGDAGALMFSVPLDIICGPISLGFLLGSNGQLWMWSNNIIDSERVCCESLFSCFVYQVGSGQVVSTFKIEAKVKDRIGSEIFGDSWDKEDDWIRPGQRLGRILLDDMAKRLPGELARRLDAR
jgi:hypothetical protein